eukprot:6690882-Pyramimonas_sp.AAC.1
MRCPLHAGNNRRIVSTYAPKTRTLPRSPGGGVPAPHGRGAPLRRRAPAGGEVSRARASSGKESGGGGGRNRGGGGTKGVQQGPFAPPPDDNNGGHVCRRAPHHGAAA